MPTKKSKPKTASKSAAARYKSLLSGQWSGDLMLGALFAEMFGTFVLATAVLITSGSIIIAAITVIVMVMALSRLSGGHLNPGVTLALLATKQISPLRAAGYIVAQLLGAMLALLVVTQFVTTGQMDPNTGQVSKVFEVPNLVGDWRPFFAEVLGAIVFGFGIAASVLNKKEGIDAGFVVGGSLLLGLLLASQASAAILNPAVALSLSAYKVGVAGMASGGWVTVWVYALAPIVGLATGAWLYKLMKWDVTGGKEKA
jgi:glycerol uptake facilitator-like aquaporin